MRPLYETMHCSYERSLLYLRMQEHYEAASDLKEAIREIDDAPTDAQREAGNYKKGHMMWKGLPLTIEIAKGMMRSGKRKDGSTWKHKLTAHYGYIKRTTGADDEKVDFFFGLDLDSEIIFIVNQRKMNGKDFDEHKVVLGCRSQEEARELYLSNYQKGWQVFSPLIAMTLDQFKDWLEDGDLSRPAKAIC